MKTKLVFLMLCLFALSVKGQDWKFAVEGGITINHPKHSFTNDGTWIGWRTGGWAKVHPMSSASQFYTTAGLLLSGKGSKIMSFMGEKQYYTSLITYRNYLEVPVRVGYDFTVNNKVKIFAEGGPYVAYALCGKQKYQGKNAETDKQLGSTTDIFGEKGFKRFDFGIGFALGVELAKHYQLKVGYDLGLINTTGTPEKYATGDKLTYKNRNITIGVAYAF